MCALFSPEILRAEAVKGLNERMKERKKERRKKERKKERNGRETLLLCLDV